ncbi:MAG: hypothetical protein H0Z33_05375 [Bacillaceae bacterium]|nr:hypothetical protein [Bacillaceae bacterium]
MQIFDLNMTSVLAGLTAIIVVALFRMHYPFRYQYLCMLFGNRPDRIKKLLQRSYKKNRSLVGILDKSSKEILDRNYDRAAQTVLSGILTVQTRPKTTLNQVISHLLYYNLALTLYYRKNYNKSLQILQNIYQYDPGLTNALALMICNFARQGDIQMAVESLMELKEKRRVNPGVMLPCLAEIEAAKGNYTKAIRLLQRSKRFTNHLNILLLNGELEQRITELQQEAEKKESQQFSSQ